MSIPKPVLRNLWMSQAKRDLYTGLVVGAIGSIVTWFGWALPKRQKFAEFER